MARQTVTFMAQVRQLQSRILATGDKGGRLVIEFNIQDDKLVGDLARFVKSDSEIKVTISE